MPATIECRKQNDRRCSICARTSATHTATLVPTPAYPMPPPRPPACRPAACTTKQIPSADGFELSVIRKEKETCQPASAKMGFDIQNWPPLFVVEYVSAADVVPSASTTRRASFSRYQAELLKLYRTCAAAWNCAESTAAAMRILKAEIIAWKSQAALFPHHRT